MVSLNSRLESNKEEKRVLWDAYPMQPARPETSCFKLLVVDRGRSCNALNRVGASLPREVVASFDALPHLLGGRRVGGCMRERGHGRRDKGAGGVKGLGCAACCTLVRPIRLFI